MRNIAKFAHSSKTTKRHCLMKRIADILSTTDKELTLSRLGTEANSLEPLNDPAHCQPSTSPSHITSEKKQQTNKLHTMKKFFAYFMATLVAVFVFAACGTEPNEPVNPNTPGNDTTVTPGDTIVNPGDTTVTPGDENLLLGNWMVDSSFVQIAPVNMTEDLGLSGTLFTINADGTLIMTADGEAETYQYTIEDNTLNLYIEENGQTLVQPLTIATLTETTLVFTAQESQQGMTADLFIYLHRVNQ